MLFQREDWQLFLDPSTLSQKAGCRTFDIGKIVLKELVDNALDTGAQVVLTREDEWWVIADDGPGLTVAQIQQFFAVNRPLLSSKLKRLPLRGMLGNGLRVVMGAVAAFDGNISVESRGHRLTLLIDRVTGGTIVEKDEPVEKREGVTVRLRLSELEEGDDALAQNSISIALRGEEYTGCSSPWWYGVRDLERLFNYVTEDVTVGNLCREWGLEHHDDRRARGLSHAEISVLLDKLRAKGKPINPHLLGSIGPGLIGDDFPGYAIKTGTLQAQSGAYLHYVVEAWAGCDRPERKAWSSVDFTIVINRSRTLASMAGAS